MHHRHADVGADAEGVIRGDVLRGHLSGVVANVVHHDRAPRPVFGDDDLPEAFEALKAGASLDPVSLSLAAHRRGFRNVYWPFARLRTEERFAPVDLAEPVEDPYLNPNLAPGASTLS